MGGPLVRVVVVAALVGAMPSLALAQFPGVGNPWHERQELPPGTGGFNPYGPNHPNIPGLPPGVGGYDHFGQQPNRPGLPPAVGTGVPSSGAKSFPKWYSVAPPSVTLGGKPLQQVSPKNADLPPGTGGQGDVAVPQDRPDLSRVRPAPVVLSPVNKAAPPWWQRHLAHLLPHLVWIAVAAIIGYLTTRSSHGS